MVLKKNLETQRGAALLIMMTVLVLTLVTLLLSGFDKGSQTISRDLNTINALSEARQALLDFALLSDTVAGSPGVGYLPCPDRNGDGLSDEPCGNPGESVEGWLPWQTLGHKPLRDSDHVCLRYAVSGDYKISPPVPLTTTTPGHFVIHDVNNTVRVGSTPAERALAVIFSAQKALAGQVRNTGAGPATTCGSDTPGAPANLAANYLENISNVNNATGTYAGPGAAGSEALPTNTPSVFILAAKQPGFNDAIAWLRPADFADVYARMP